MRECARCEHGRVTGSGRLSVARRLQRVMRMPSLRLLGLLPLVACATNTNDVLVQLAPDVVSSLDGTVTVHSIAFGDRDPKENQALTVSVAYTDRNGTAHMIAPVSGTTDKNGAFDTVLTGLSWDGTGTVTVAAGTITGAATFAVLDRTPPKVTIVPPAGNVVHINMNTAIQVHATDEIGVSAIYFDTNRNGGGGGNGQRELLASGATDTMLSFDFQVGGSATVGQMITLYALAADLSGNEAAAMPITVTVAQ